MGAEDTRIGESDSRGGGGKYERRSDFVLHLYSLE